MKGAAGAGGSPRGSAAAGETGAAAGSKKKAPAGRRVPASENEEHLA